MLLLLLLQVARQGARTTLLPPLQALLPLLLLLLLLHSPGRLLRLHSTRQNNPTAQHQHSATTVLSVSTSP
jgi:hypothetical protein